eukprot:m.37774 g.37774  ORF g.37774 m.37774 type:complete len:606 (+) comp11133_c0_seq1:273-2090(+)
MAGVGVTTALECLGYELCGDSDTLVFKATTKTPDSSQLLGSLGWRAEPRAQRQRLFVLCDTDVNAGRIRKLLQEAVKSAVDKLELPGCAPIVHVVCALLPANKRTKHAVAPQAAESNPIACCNLSPLLHKSEIDGMVSVLKAAIQGPDDTAKKLAKRDRALARAVKQAQESGNDSNDRHIFVLCLAALRAKYQPAVKLVSSALSVLKRESKNLLGAICFLRLVVPGQAGVVKASELRPFLNKFPDLDTCDLVVCTEDGGFTVFHPLFAALVIRQPDVVFAATTLQACDDDVSNLSGLSTTHLLEAWKRVVDSLKYAVIPASLPPILRAVFVCREGRYPFSRLVWNIVCKCGSLTRTKVLVQRLEEFASYPEASLLKQPHIDVLVSRVLKFLVHRAIRRSESRQHDAGATTAGGWADAIGFAVEKAEAASKTLQHRAGWSLTKNNLAEMYTTLCFACTKAGKSEDAAKAAQKASILFKELYKHADADFDSEQRVLNQVFQREELMAALPPQCRGYWRNRQSEHEAPEQDGGANGREDEPLARTSSEDFRSNVGLLMRPVCTIDAVEDRGDSVLEELLPPWSDDDDNRYDNSDDDDELWGAVEPAEG